MAPYTFGHVECFSHEDSGRILVKQSLPNEKETYELLDENFRLIVPQVFKITALGGAEYGTKKGVQNFAIRMENLSHTMANPAYLDLKIGKWLYNEGHEDYEKLTSNFKLELKHDPYALTIEERRNKCWPKWRLMQWRMQNMLYGKEFFGVNGFKHGKIDELYSQYDRFDYDSQLTCTLLQDFFKGFDATKKFVVEQIKLIKNTLINGNLLEHRTPFHSSIFICFDLENPDNCQVKLIDFGRCYPHSEVKENVREEQKKTIIKACDNIIEYIINAKKAKKKIKPNSDIDFDKVVEECEEMDKQMADNDVNVFFEQLFAKSSPEVQMAMKKSFLESKGTVLSTNWDDVGSKEVKPYESQDDK